MAFNGRRILLLRQIIQGAFFLPCELAHKALVKMEGVLVFRVALQNGNVPRAMFVARREVCEE